MKNLIVMALFLALPIVLFAQGIKQGQMVSGKSEVDVQPIKIVDGLWTLPIKTDGTKTEGVKVGKTIGVIEIEYISSKNIYVIHAREVGTSNELQFVALDSSVNTIFRTLDLYGEKDLFLYGMKVSKSRLSLLGRSDVNLESHAYVLVGVSAKNISDDVALVAIFDNTSEESEETAFLIKKAGDGSGLLLETSLAYKREPRKTLEMQNISKFLIKSKFLVIRSWRMIEPSRDRHVGNQGPIKRTTPRKKNQQDDYNSNGDHQSADDNFLDSFVRPD